MQTPVLISSACARCRQPRSHEVVPMVAAPLRRAASRGYRLRCMACGWTVTPVVLHALVDGAGALCSLPAGSEAVVAETGAITCRACRVLTERVYAKLADVEVHCTRCDVKGPARRHAAVQRDGADRVVTTCTRCGGRHERGGLRHWQAPDPSPALRCGLVRADAVRGLDPSRVTCPLCLQSALPGLTAERHAVVEQRCTGCAGVRAHEVYRVPIRRRVWAVLVCDVCGEAAPGGRLRHWARDDFPCAAPRGSPRTEVLAHVTCGDCLDALLCRAVLPLPDWRPVESIPEDHYAA